MKVWSTKLEWNPTKDKTGKQKKQDQEMRLRQLLNEVEMKQKYVLKLMQTKENLKTNKKVHQAKGELKTKMQESVEMLVILSRENKEDADDIKLHLKQSQIDV